MSIDGEQDLRQRLDRAFGTIAPRPAPVDDAIRHGRVIRTRRWLAAAAGAAVAVAAAVAVPAVLARQAADNAVTARPPAVTVHPAGPHAPAGLIAWGRVGSSRWALRVGKPSGSGASESQLVSALGSGVYLPGLTPGQSPVGWQQMSAGPPRPQEIIAPFGPVRADVAYVTATLSDGRVLTLHPVRAYGVRFVAFAAPEFMISKVTAYSARGVLASAVPLHAPHGALIFNAWLRPGQAVLPRRTWLIGSGNTAGVAWSVGIYQGPWGYCVLDNLLGGVSSGCYQSPGQAKGRGIGGRTFGPPELIWGFAPPRAAHVVVVMSDHSRVRVRVVTAGQSRYFAFAVASNHLSVNRWMAYDAARQAVGRG